MKSVSKRSVAAGIILLAVCGAVTAAVLIREFRGQPVLESLLNARISWLIPGLLAMCFYCFAEGLNIRRCLKLGNEGQELDGGMLEIGDERLELAGISPGLSSEGQEPGSDKPELSSERQEHGSEGMELGGERPELSSERQELGGGKRGISSEKPDSDGDKSRFSSGRQEPDGKKNGLRKCLKYALAGFFFSAITPSASGGQPAQLYLMNRDGIPLSCGAFSLLAGVVSFQMSSVFLGICGAVHTWQTVSMGYKKNMSLLFAVGFSMNFAVLIMELCVLFSGRFADFASAMVNSAARFFQKFKAESGAGPHRKEGTEVHSKVKISIAEENEENGKFNSNANDRKSSEKIADLICEYRKTSKVLRRSPLVIVKMLATSLLQLLLYNSIPFFCAKALGLKASWLSCTLTQSALFVSVSSLPLPGASGVTEAGFAGLFAPCFSATDLASLLILSRTVSFIIPLAFSGLSLLAISLNSRVLHR